MSETQVATAPTAAPTAAPAFRFPVQLSTTQLSLELNHGVINTVDKAKLVPNKDGTKQVPLKVQIPYDYFRIVADSDQKRLSFLNAILLEQEKSNAGSYAEFVNKLEEKILEDANDKAWKSETVGGVTTYVVDQAKFAELLKNPPQKASSSLTVMKKEQGELGIRIANIGVASRLAGATPQETEAKQSAAAAALGLAASPAALVTALGAAYARYMDLTARITEADKKRAERAKKA